MTNYTDKEYSDHSGAPVEGYEFAGTFKTYRYTSAEQDLSNINGHAYTAAAITRQAVRAGTQDDDNLDLELEMPLDLELVTDYAYVVSPPDLTLTIYRYHQGTNPASDWIVLWKGPVTSFSVTGKVAKVRVPSIFTTAISGEVPNRFYQNPCNHVLYDARCKVDVNSFKATTTVVSITDDTHILVGNDGFSNGFLNGGEVLNTTRSERRLVINNVDNLITISYPFFNIQVGDNIEIHAGCNHSFTICKSKFNNTVNYGGFPYVPSDNPFEGQVSEQGV